MNFSLFIIIFIIISIISIIWFIVLSNSLVYSDSNYKCDCDILHPLSKNNGDSCGKWENSQCKKGITKNGQCNVNKNILPTILLTISITSFVISVILIVVGMKQNIGNPDYSHPFIPKDNRYRNRIPRWRMK